VIDLSLTVLELRLSTLQLFAIKNK